MARIDVAFIEADQNALEVKNVLYVLQEFGEILARQLRGDGIMRQKKS